MELEHYSEFLNEQGRPLVEISSRDFLNSLFSLEKLNLIAEGRRRPVVPNENRIRNTFKNQMMIFFSHLTTRVAGTERFLGLHETVNPFLPATPATQELVANPEDQEAHETTEAQENAERNSPIAILKRLLVANFVRKSFTITQVLRIAGTELSGLTKSDVEQLIEHLESEGFIRISRRIGRNKCYSLIINR